MTVDLFFQRIEDDNRRQPGTHATEAALTDRELLLWEKAHPGWTVPDSLIGLLRRSNGFRLRLDKDFSGGAYCCFSPLKDIRKAAPAMYGEDCDGDECPNSWFALAQDSDSTSFLVLDMKEGVYLDVDPIDADEATRLSKSIEGALTWLAGYFPEGR
jgi:hypothetical protein